MKTDKYQRRFYRDWIDTKDLYLARIYIKETDLQILADRPVDKGFVKERINLYRRQIEDYIIKDRRFLSALKPIVVAQDAPFIVRKMAQAASKANVGPMAAVAGAIAELIGCDLLGDGFNEVIVENGGDIFLKTQKVRIVRIYSARTKLWKNIGLKIRPQDAPLGICTSSGTLGHSLSFGSSDSTTILSKDTFLADAVATACANLIHSKKDLVRAVNFARAVRGVEAAVIVIKNDLISWGKLEFVA